jgi:hypothetical protein
MSFYYYPSHNGSIREFRPHYTLFKNTTDNLTDSNALIFDGPLVSSFPRPEIQAISYNEQEISAYCDDGLCAFGNYTTTPYLSFKLQDSRTNAITQLHAVDNEWEFNNDAPSVELRVQMSDGKLASIALKTDVTQRNHCASLKVCLSSRTPDFVTLAPLGVLLMAQERYSFYCSQPRLYQL